MEKKHDIVATPQKTDSTHTLLFTILVFLLCLQLISWGGTRACPILYALHHLYVLGSKNIVNVCLNAFLEKSYVEVVLKLTAVLRRKKKRPMLTGPKPWHAITLVKFDGDNIMLWWSISLAGNCKLMGRWIQLNTGHSWKNNNQKV